MKTTARKKRMPAKRSPNVAFDNTAAGAVVRLSLYVSTYPEQMDHDRDVLLLDIHRMLKELTNK